MGDADERGDAIAAHRARHDHRDGDLRELVGARLGEPSDAASVEQYERMYGDPDGPIGRRTAASDWAMFGLYIRHNIGIAFQCFAGGLFFGVGSLFALAFNGAAIGSTAGYLTWRGFGANFYPFVITHGAFELTGIVLAGAAGLILGHALLVPGRRSRLAALEHAARGAIVIVYGMTAMFAIAAVLEAFWSSARSGASADPGLVARGRGSARPRRRGRCRSARTRHG